MIERILENIIREVFIGIRWGIIISFMGFWIIKGLKWAYEFWLADDEEKKT